MRDKEEVIAVAESLKAQGKSSGAQVQELALDSPSDASCIFIGGYRYG